MRMRGTLLKTASGAVVRGASVTTVNSLSHWIWTGPRFAERSQPLQGRGELSSQEAFRESCADCAAGHLPADIDMHARRVLQRLHVEARRQSGPADCARHKDARRFE